MTTSLAAFKEAYRKALVEAQPLVMRRAATMPCPWCTFDEDRFFDVLFHYTRARIAEKRARSSNHYSRLSASEAEASRLRWPLFCLSPCQKCAAVCSRPIPTKLIRKECP